MTTVTLEQIAEEDDKYLVTDGDVGLGSNHPKLQAFQTAVKAALTKRVREAEEELFRLKKVFFSYFHHFHHWMTVSLSETFQSPLFFHFHHSELL